jgi:hypothetical protein
VATTEAIDTVVREGLGLRWALMGPFAVGNTNADGGIREYFQRYAGPLGTLSKDLGSDLNLSPELIEHIAKSVDGIWRRVPRAQQRVWRDDMVLRLRELKAAHPVVPPDPDD